MQYATQISQSGRCEPSKYYEYKKTSNAELFEELQSLRKHEIFCDIKLETDDKKIIFAHKVVLASASPFFRAMLTTIPEKNDVVIRDIHSSDLLLLVNFIYSGEIVITEKNVQDLLPAASLLQLQEIKDACWDFLEYSSYRLLCPTNCISLKEIADLHNLSNLLKSSELYIQQHFSETVDTEEFLSISYEQIVKLISSDELIVPSEEKVYESVIRWVKYDLESRKQFLPQLMEHVRLPLACKHYILKKVVEEPLIKNCLKCKDYVIEALHYHLLNSEELIQQTTRNKPRRGDQVILVVGGTDPELCKCTVYDLKLDLWRYGPAELVTSRGRAGLATLKDLVFAVGGVENNDYSLRSVDELDLLSEPLCWRPTGEMSVKRQYLGVGVIKDNLYAVGGHHINDVFNSAEVYNYTTRKWRSVSKMYTKRSGLGVGVLNDLLYVVGGYHNYFIKQGTKRVKSLKTVECYHPDFDTWTLVESMCVRRIGAGVGVMDGVLYAVGGRDGSKILSSVETYKPSIGVWISIADMNLPRSDAGVVVLNGFLYVVGGNDGTSSLNSVDCYNPQTNTWMETQLMIDARTSAGVVAINRPQILNTC